MKGSNSHGLTAPLSRQRAAGFTLIEALIVMAVLGILGAIALPSYFEYVRKSSRADAKAILMETAQFMERYYTTHSPPSYDGVGNPPYQTSPKGATGSGIRYNISWNGTPGATFTLRAIPANSQAGDSCGTLSITNTGVTTPTTTGCW